MKKQNIVPLIALLSLTGCSLLKPVSIGAFPAVSLPQEEDKSKDTKIRVLLTKIEDNTSSGVYLGLSKKARGKLVSILRDGGITIVDANRSIRDKLKTEFALLEAGGVSNYTPPKAANLAAGGEVSNATLIPQPRAAVQYTDDGKQRVIPAHCVYTARVEGVMNFYYTNPLALKEGYTYSGTKTFNDNGAGRGSCPELSKSTKQSLFTEALQDAANDVKYKIKNLLAAKGHVVRARKDPKKGTYYYRISIKPADGAVPGVKVMFIEPQMVDGVKEYFPFGEGVIVKTDMQQISYVKVTNEEAIRKIKKGTRVKLRFTGGMFSLPKLLGK